MAAADLYSKPPIPAMSQKKALLIGIQYDDSENEENGALEGPHQGVMELKKLLVGEVP